MKRRRKSTPKEIHDLPSFGFRTLTVTVDLPEMDDPDAVARAISEKLRARAQVLASSTKQLMRVESVVEHHSGGEEVTARRWPDMDRWGRNPSLSEPIEVTIVADVGTFRLHDKITVSITRAGGKVETNR
jgi:hypothetical protein